MPVTLVNKTYREFADHYGCAVVPARVRKPRDKGLAESSVDLVEKWAIAPSNEMTFYTLDEFNEFLWERVDWINARPFSEREGSRVPAQAYVYARRREGTLMREPWDSKDCDRVWYAGYGSNLSAERFACYIKGGACKENGNPYDGCTDKTLWSESCLRDYPGRMYFGQKSRSWKENEVAKGVAFYDPAQPGETHMRLYQISRAQLHEVQAQERLSPKWYGRLVTLDVHEDGCPIYTFTSEMRHEHNAPSAAYLNLIRTALIEECGLSEKETETYLNGCMAT